MLCILISWLFCTWRRTKDFTIRDSFSFKNKTKTLKLRRKRSILILYIQYFQVSQFKFAVLVYACLANVCGSFNSCILSLSLEVHCVKECTLNCKSWSNQLHDISINDLSFHKTINPSLILSASNMFSAGCKTT